MPDEPKLTTAHPLWPAFRNWERRRHCGVPDLTDAHDHEVFAAFVEGAKHGSPWIPVRECPPKEAKTVLVTDGEGVSLARLCHGGHWSYGGARATHWMPLPPPPAA